MPMLLSLLLLAAHAMGQSCSGTGGTPAAPVFVTDPCRSVLSQQAASYANNQDCVWTLKAPLECRISVTFLQFAVAASDSLTFYDGLIGENQWSAWAGTSTPPTLVSTGPFATFYLKTDASNTAAGFTLAYEHVCPYDESDTPSFSQYRFRFREVQACASTLNTTATLEVRSVSLLTNTRTTVDVASAVVVPSTADAVVKGFGVWSTVFNCLTLGEQSFTVTLPTPAAVKYYAISSTGTKAPINWIVEGSNDGSAWRPLSVQTDPTAANAEYCLKSLTKLVMPLLQNGECDTNIRGWTSTGTWSCTASSSYFIGQLSLNFLPTSGARYWRASTGTLRFSYDLSPWAAELQRDTYVLHASGTTAYSNGATSSYSINVLDSAPSSIASTTSSASTSSMTWKRSTWWTVLAAAARAVRIDASTSGTGFLDQLSLTFSRNSVFYCTTTQEIALTFPIQRGYFAGGLDFTYLSPLDCTLSFTSVPAGSARYAVYVHGDPRYFGLGSATQDFVSVTAGTTTVATWTQSNKPAVGVRVGALPPLKIRLKTASSSGSVAVWWTKVEYPTITGVTNQASPSSPVSVPGSILAVAGSMLADADFAIVASTTVYPCPAAPGFSSTPSLGFCQLPDIPQGTYAVRATRRGYPLAQATFNAAVSVVPTAATPILIRVSPSAATAGTQLTLTGSNLSPASAISALLQPSGTFCLSVTAITEGSVLTCTLPSILPISGTQFLHLSLSAAQVEPPAIVTIFTLTVASAVPMAAAAGDRFTIYGSGFGTNSAEVSVAFGTSSCELAVLTDAQLQCVIPSGSGSRDVTLTRGSSSRGLGRFSYTTRHTVQTVFPSSAAPLDLITVFGDNFPPATSTFQVLLGTYPCSSPSLASDGLSITCTIPPASQSGDALGNGDFPVTVLKDGLRSLTSVPITLVYQCSSSAQCQNGGVCSLATSASSAFSCACSAPFFGLRCEQESLVCDKTSTTVVTAVQGTLSDGPGTYLPNLDCTWVYAPAPVGTSTTLRSFFTQLDIPSNYGDSLVLSRSSSQLTVQTSASYFLTESFFGGLSGDSLRFTTNNQRQAQGFTQTFEIAKAYGCTSFSSSIVSETGDFYVHDGYLGPTSTLCSRSFRGPTNSVYAITIRYLSLPTGGTLNFTLTDDISGLPFISYTFGTFTNIGPLVASSSVTVAVNSPDGNAAMDFFSMELYFRPIDSAATPVVSSATLRQMKSPATASSQPTVFIQGLNFANSITAPISVTVNAVNCPVWALSSTDILCGPYSVQPQKEALQVPVVVTSNTVASSPATLSVVWVQLDSVNPPGGLITDQLTLSGLFGSTIGDLVVRVTSQEPLVEFTGTCSLGTLQPVPSSTLLSTLTASLPSLPSNGLYGLQVQRTTAGVVVSSEFRSFYLVSSLQIDAFSPSFGGAGTVLSIFTDQTSSALLGSTSVTVGGVACPLLSVASSTILCAVPALGSGTHAVVVSIGSLSVQASSTFAVYPPGNLISINPTEGLQGVVVTASVQFGALPTEEQISATVDGVAAVIVPGSLVVSNPQTFLSSFSIVVPFLPRSETTTVPISVFQSAVPAQPSQPFSYFPSFTVASVTPLGGAPGTLIRVVGVFPAVAQANITLTGNGVVFPIVPASLIDILFNNETGYAQFDAQIPSNPTLGGLYVPLVLTAYGSQVSPPYPVVAVAAIPVPPVVSFSPQSSTPGALLTVDLLTAIPLADDAVLDVDLAIVLGANITCPIQSLTTTAGSRRMVSTLVCLVPSTIGGGSFPLSVLHYGVRSNHSAQSFQTLVAPTIRSISPAGGIQSTTITLLGQFASTNPNDDIFVRVGTFACALQSFWSISPFNSSFIESALICLPQLQTLPDGDAVVAVTITRSGLESSPVAFTFIQPPNLSAVFPSEALDGSILTLSANYIGCSGTGALSVIVSPVSVPTSNLTVLVECPVIPSSISCSTATFGSVQCILGPAVVGLYALQLQRFTVVSNSSVTVAYVDRPRLDIAAPSSGVAGDIVVLTGVNLGQDESSVRVEIGLADCPIVVGSFVQLPSGLQQVNCTVPPVSGVGLRDIVFFRSNLSAIAPFPTFRYPGQPVLQTISPLAGPTVGGTEILISGVDIGDNPQWTRVTIGGIEAPLVSIDVPNAAMRVQSPAGVGTQQVTVIVGGVSSNETMLFAYQSPSVTAISPSVLPYNFQTALTVTGTNFGPPSAIGSGLVSVWIGGIQCPAAALSGSPDHTELVCSSLPPPPENTPYPAPGAPFPLLPITETVEIRVAQHVAYPPNPLLYSSPLNVTGIVPRNGVNGTTVSVVLQGLPATAAVEDASCQYTLPDQSTMIVSAVALTNTSVSCVVPDASPGEFILIQASFDGGERWISGGNVGTLSPSSSLVVGRLSSSLLQFLYVPIPVVQSVCPTRLPAFSSGGFNVFGSGFLESSELYCRISNNETEPAMAPATFLSSSIVFCPASLSFATGSGEFLLQISNNGQQWSTASSTSTVVFFEFPSRLGIRREPFYLMSQGGLLSIQPVIQLLDGKNQPVAQAGVVIAVRTDPPETSITGNSAISNSEGRVDFTSVGFYGRRGQAYRLIFFDPNAVIASVNFSSIFVLPCAGVRAHSVQPTSESEVCLCEPGYTPSAVVDENGNSPCTVCDAGTYKSGVGEFGCTPCPPNMLSPLGSTDVSQCYCRPEYFSRGQFGVCEPCPVGLACLGGDDVQVREGYWLSSVDRFSTFTCKVPSACAGGGNGTCAPAYEGPLCGNCAPGYGKIGVGCFPCPNPSANGAVLFVLAVFSVCMIMVFIRTSKNRRGGVGTLLKLFVSYFQVLALLTQFKVQWPASFVGFLQIPSFLTADTQMISAQCAFSLSYFDRLTIIFCLPLITAAIVIVSYVLLGIIDMRKTDGFIFETLVERSELGVMLVWYLIHPSIVKEVLSIYNCVDLKEDRYLSVDLSVSCSTNHYKNFRAIATIYLLVYCVGLILLAFYLLWKNRRAFVYVNDQESKKYMFLVGGFNLKTYYWEIVIMTRKILIVLISVFLSVWAQIFCAILVLYCSILFDRIKRPFPQTISSNLERLSLWALVFTVTTAILLQTSHDERAKTFLGVLLIFVHLAVAMYFIFALRQAGIVDDVQRGVKAIKSRLGVDDAADVVLQSRATRGGQSTAALPTDPSVEERASVVARFRQDMSRTDLITPPAPAGAAPTLPPQQLRFEGQA